MSTLAELARTAEALPEVAEARVVVLPGNVPPWTGTGLTLGKGDAVTLLAEGRVVTSPELGLWYGPGFGLWGRIGGKGPIFNPPGGTLTLRAERDGELELAVYSGEWGTPDGELATPVEAYAGLSGELRVLVLRWRGAPEAGLGALAAEAPNAPLVADALRRRTEPVRPPEGWRHLWFLGETEIFREGRDERGERVIDVATEADVGILQKRVDAPLDAEASLAWRWRVDELPGREPENAPHLHDYLSIAVEFENGKDLTYYWSAALPVGTHYACPLPTWAERETHYVLRSGPEGLGEWHAERRPLRADYAQCIGEPPSRIVGVWLIAVSLFGRRRGRAAFADIAIESGEGSLRVF